MPPGPLDPREFRRRLVGLYALSLMEREGPLHGYRLSESIAQRTDGAWRPGPGSVYPSLGKLVENGLARAKVEGRRRTYTLTRDGERLLATVRARQQSFGQGRPDAALLWAYILGDHDAGEFLVRRLRHTLERTAAFLEAGPGTEAERERLRREVVTELRRTTERLAVDGDPVRRPSAGGTR